MAGRKVRDAREARTCLDEVEASGMPRAEWARKHGIDARSLNAWRLNLERRPAEATALRLVELVPEKPSSEPAPLRVRCGPFTVEVPSDFDDDVLARVLSLVASC